MQVKILGCYGGNAKGYYSTSFMVNKLLLLDAGSAAQVLTVKEQAHLNAVVLTHSHLDHVCTIPFIADNINGKKEHPIDIISHKDVIDPLKKHLLNDKIWPDFTQIPHTLSPVLRIRTIAEGNKFDICGLKLTAVKVSHAIPTYGFIIEERDKAFVFTGDTAPTKKIWDVINRHNNIKFIITEVSYPNRMEHHAKVSRHMTPAMLGEEIKKINDKKIPIYIYHLKPQYLDETTKEIRSMNLRNVRILRQGETLRI